MSVNIYDRAIIDELKLRFMDNRITICPAENIFRTIASDINGGFDKISLPMISVTRNRWEMNPPQHSQKFEGATLNYDFETDYVQNIQFIPISIYYSIDIWTRTREENDIILRELIFYYSNHPELVVSIPYGSNYSHRFNIFFENEIEDNSDILEHKNRGEYFRQTIGMYTDDARLWKTSSRGFTKIDIELDMIREKDGGE